MDCECPAEAGVCMWQLIHGNYKASKQICCCLANVVFDSSRKLSDFTFIPSTLGEPPEGKVVRRSSRRQQPLTSQRVKSHLGMKVSVGGWNDWAPRDYQAARRGAGADVKYIIRQGAANGCATQIAFATFFRWFLQLWLRPEALSPQRVPPSRELLEHLGSTGVCVTGRHNVAATLLVGTDTGCRGTVSAAIAQNEGWFLQSKTTQNASQSLDCKSSLETR